MGTEMKSSLVSGTWDEVLDYYANLAKHREILPVERKALKRRAENWCVCAVGEALKLDECVTDETLDEEIAADAVNDTDAKFDTGHSFAKMGMSFYKAVQEGDWELAKEYLREIQRIVTPEMRIHATAMFIEGRSFEYRDTVD